MMPEYGGLAATSAVATTPAAAPEPADDAPPARRKRRCGGGVTLAGLAARRDYLPGGRRWDSLRVVLCGACRGVLLGPSEEHLRGMPDRLRVRRLPPAAVQVEGRYYCGPCAGEGGVS